LTSLCLYRRWLLRCTMLIWWATNLFSNLSMTFKKRDFIVDIEPWNMSKNLHLWWLLTLRLFVFRALRFSLLFKGMILTICSPVRFHVSINYRRYRLGHLSIGPWQTGLGCLLAHVEWILRWIIHSAASLMIFLFELWISLFLCHCNRVLMQHLTIGLLLLQINSFFVIFCIVIFKLLALLDKLACILRIKWQSLGLLRCFNRLSLKSLVFLSQRLKALVCSLFLRNFHT
jgi:hypothetical protein